MYRLFLGTWQVIKSTIAWLMVGDGSDIADQYLNSEPRRSYTVCDYCHQRVPYGIEHCEHCGALIIW